MRAHEVSFLDLVQGEKQFQVPLYQRPYSWAERTELMRTLKPHGYGFYLYAPKADAFLRRRWREPHRE